MEGQLLAISRTRGMDGQLLAISQTREKARSFLRSHEVAPSAPRTAKGRLLTSSAASWPRSSGFSSGNRSSCRPAMVTSWSRSPGKGGRGRGVRAWCGGGGQRQPARGQGHHPAAPLHPRIAVPKGRPSSALHPGGKTQARPFHHLFLKHVPPSPRKRFEEAAKTEEGAKREERKGGRKSREEKGKAKRHNV